MSTSMIPSRPAEETETSRPKPAARRIPHLPYLDGARALAALYVLAHHMLLQVWPAADRSGGARGPLAPAALGWLVFGHAAVAFFIVLSGFCLALPAAHNGGALRGGIGSFFFRRARRILPPYYLALALSLILIVTLIGTKTGTHWDCSVPVTLRGLWLHLLLLQDLFGSDEINHVFWSVALEWRIYFLFPVLLLGWRRWGPAATTAGAMAVGFGAALVASKTGLPIRSLQFIGLFATGMLAAAIAFSSDGTTFQRFRDRAPWPLMTGGMLVLAVALLNRCSSLIADTALATLSAALLIALTTETPGGEWLRRLLGSRLLVSLGAFSYSLYLVHAPLIQLVWQYGLMGRVRLNDTASFFLLASVGSPLILGASYLFYLACERPFQSRQPADPARRSPAPDSVAVFTATVTSPQ